MAVPLLLDTDIGDDVDDVFAVLLAALHRDFALLGVTTVYGDAPHRARVARKLLDVAGRQDVPVAVGYGATLSGRDVLAQREPGTAMTSARGFVAPPGSAEWDALGSRLDRRHAVDFLMDAIRIAPERPTLVAIGPLTNVAALIERAPEAARRLRSVVVMGGRLGPDAARGEHNFNCDVEATAIVLDSGLPLQIGTYEVTCQARLGHADVDRLRAGTPGARAAAEQLALYLDANKRHATSMYDPLSLTMAYTDRFLPTAPAALRWQREGERLLTLSVEPDAPPTATVSTGLDAAGFVEHLLSTIGGG